MDHYNIVIVSNDELNLPDIRDISYIQVDLTYRLISDTSIKGKDKEYTFDYLIFDDLNIIGNIEILEEDGKVVVNNFFQTSIENFFVIGNLNNSKKNIEKQLKIIIDFILNPF